MPTLSTFLGIIITMYQEVGGRHNIPHIHARYAEHEAVYDFDGNLIEGALPRKQHKLVQAWIVLRSDDIKTNWVLIQNGKAHYKIEPLK